MATKTTSKEPDVVRWEPTEDEDVFDFSYTREYIPFKIGTDVFRAAPDIPVEAAMDFAEKADVLDNEDADVEEKKSVMQDMFRMILYPDDAERFIERLSSRTHPIGVGKVREIVQWLFTEYGMRPTEPSEDSLDGSPTTPESGNSLTENTSDEE